MPVRNIAVMHVDKPLDEREHNSQLRMFASYLYNLPHCLYEFSATVKLGQVEAPKHGQYHEDSNIVFWYWKCIE